MLSFHNDPAVKKKYIDRLQAHRSAEQLVQGDLLKLMAGCKSGIVC